jgi:hypothetical protein
MTPYEDGFRAKMRGEPMTANPYPDWTDVHGQWNDGWREVSLVRHTAEECSGKLTEKARGLADRLDSALALVPSNPEGADIFLGDMILLAAEISYFLRTVERSTNTPS